MDKISFKKSILDYETINNREFIIDSPKNFKVLRMPLSIRVKRNKDTGRYFTVFSCMDSSSLHTRPEFDSEEQALVFGIDCIKGGRVTFLS